MLDEDLLYSNKFADMMAEGFIYIDNKGFIQIYNEMAKKIFGLRREYYISHGSGKIAKGDIVIIANSAFSYDDGNMDEGSLKKLGLKGDEIQKNQPFISISEYGVRNLGYKYGKKNEFETLELDKIVKGLKIGASIDNIKRLINIRIDDVDFPLHYVKAIGNIVVIDGKTEKLKFYQTYGYTARKESINDILNGEGYSEKNIGVQDLNVIGKNIFDIHTSETLIQNFYEIAGGKNIEVRNKFEEINGFPILCTIFPVEVDKVVRGAALRVEDISKIESVIRERDNILKQLEIKSKQVDEQIEAEKRFVRFIGSDKKIIQAKTLAYRASQNNSTVLIRGEKGVGKTLLASLIHENSELGKADFIYFNSKTLTREHFIEKLESVENATLYFKEIGKLDLELQEDLLNIINSFNKKKFRIIASSSENLDNKMMEEEFSEKLYYGINIYPIQISPLRKRKFDIRSIVEYYVIKISAKFNEVEKRISNEALDMIEDYTWPNNVTELINVLERSVSISVGRNILTKHIILMHDINNQNEDKKTLKEYLEEHEKNIIRTSLALNKGDKKQTIKDLKVSQSTFYEKLNKYNIT